MTRLIVALVIAIFILCSAVVLSQGDPAIWGPKGGGVMPPDYTFVQRGNGQTDTYHIHETASSLAASRNGVPWLKITNVKGYYLISDPRGTGKTVIRLYAPAR